MKIAICGPSGAGKTTLANYIAGELCIDYVRTKGENLRMKYHCASHKDVIKMSAEKPESGYNYQKELLMERARLLDSEKDLVMDRSFIDNVAYFLLQNSPYCSGNTTYHFIAQAISLMPKLTHIIFIPPMYDRPEEDGVRVDNIHYQQMTWTVMEYVAEKYFRLDKLQEPKSFVVNTYNLEQRKKQVFDFLVGKSI